MKEEKANAIEEKKKRREENETRRIENERKSETVQKVSLRSDSEMRRAMMILMTRMTY
jgi:hypothetical protein